MDRVERAQMGIVSKHACTQKGVGVDDDVIDTVEQLSCDGQTFVENRSVYFESTLRVVARTTHYTYDFGECEFGRNDFVLSSVQMSFESARLFLRHYELDQVQPAKPVSGELAEIPHRDRSQVIAVSMMRAATCPAWLAH